VAVGVGLHKLMTYKDEYEVARLMLLDAARAQAEQVAGRGARVRFYLHPPLLRAMGLDHKIALGKWALPLFHLLRSARRLRGTVADPFGYAEVRRVERNLVVEYESAVRRSLSRLDPATHDLIVDLAALPDVVRGYEDVKLRTVGPYRTRQKELLDRIEASMGAGVPRKQ
jgi:indolepyruvate ferredoxin oxidoreductase